MYNVTFFHIKMSLIEWDNIISIYEWEVIQNFMNIELFKKKNVLVKQKNSVV